MPLRLPVCLARALFGPNVFSGCDETVCMGKVIPLHEYRAAPLHEVPHGLPELGGADIWGRDYKDVDNVVYAILRIREILDYHVHFSEEWKHFLLSMLQYVWEDGGEAGTRLLETILLLRQYVLEETTVVNKKDMCLVLVLLELVEKSRRPCATTH